MLVFIALFTVFVSLLVSYLWTLNSRYKYFICRNIPGPPPRFFFGHYLTLWNTSSYFSQIHKWTQQYGPIYGLFEGTRPVYVVSDVDFLEEIFIKQFATFHSHRLNFLTTLLKNSGANLFTAHLSEWRRQRHAMNPIFTMIKLKTMVPLMNKCIQSMMMKIAARNNTEFNIFTLYRRLTMDVFWQCVFGIETDMQNDPNNMYMRKSMNCLKNNIDKLFIVKLSNVMPFLIPVLIRYVQFRALIMNALNRMMPSLMSNLPDMASFWIIKRITKVIKERLTSGKKRMDLLQLMLDAAAHNQIKDNEDDLKSKKLQHSEVVMNLLLFMVAGTESTAGVLAYSTYALATHPDIQAKLQSEINEHWKEGHNEIDYEVVADMTYMEYFIREVLRMYRLSGQNSTRQCNKATTVYGHQIDQGCVILPDVYAVHHNIDLWGPEDPNLFVPERHAIKRHPVAYLGFGVGPRNCIGMKFALIQLKLCLVRLLYTYNVLPGENIEKGIVPREANIITPDGIYVRLEKRLNQSLKSTDH